MPKKLIALCLMLSLYAPVTATVGARPARADDAPSPRRTPRPTPRPGPHDGGDGD